jgi:GT2 family glycosyltransferase
MVKVSILVPVFNGLSYTQKCLQNLFSQVSELKNEVEIFVIVIDDGSTDGTSEWIENNYPDVILLHGDGNLWWSGGINEGARYSVEKLHANYVLLWNNDVCTNDDYFKMLKNVVLNGSDDVITGSKIYIDPAFSTLWSVGGTFDFRTGKKTFNAYNEKDGKEFNTIKEVDWLPGMGTLVPTSIIKKIGYWDNIHFPQYHGDSDFTLRARREGFKVIIHPDLKIWNDKTNSGLWHKGKLSLFFKSLFNIRSNFNIKKDFQFYHKHTDSVFAYYYLFKKYFIYTGSFIKWFFLGVFGVKKTNFN